MKLVWRLVINAAALWVSAELIPGVVFDGEWLDLAILAVIFGLVNAFIRPVVKILTLPLTIVTLGLFALVVNAGMLLITAALADSLSIDGGAGQQFVTAVFAAIVISIVSVVLSAVLPDNS